MNVAKGDCRTPLGSSEASVKGALQRARATLEARLPAGREEPPPGSPRERQLASRFAAAVETSDIDAVLDLLTSDAWLTMPPEPYEYQGRAAIARFLHHRPACAALPCAWHPPEPTPSPPSAATAPAPRHRSHGPTG
jgi:hypothetical protein